ncbi:MAG TPA: FAD-dependent oxidoreductase [Gemmatimonadaceae bacterium]|nr:FAD-dependent oxidoreductase [Gemmatimonadaceae bacterium]
MQEHLETIVIGAGQAGLATGYHLAKRGVRFTILDANERVGDSWRKRWDSLRLFSYAKFDGLPGKRFPASPNAFPTKDEMADYLESYAREFRLPVRSDVRVERVSREGGRFAIDSSGGRFVAERVIVAMANYQQPRVPEFASQLDGGIVQFHSSAYRNPAQLRDGDVLIVGAGNSGAEIAAELSRTGRTVYLAGRDVGKIPWRGEDLASKLLLQRVLFRVVFHRLLTARTPIGRKARAQGHTTTPLIRIMASDLARAGVVRCGRVRGTLSGRPLLDTGETVAVTNVIWATGFELGFSWIDLPIFDERGEPRHVRGEATDVPGLYFVGLHFLYAMSSAMVHGVGRDAEYVAHRIALTDRQAPRETARTGRAAPYMLTG